MYKSIQKQFKKGTAIFLAGLCIMGGTVTVYGAEDSKPQTLQETVEKSPEINTLAKAGNAEENNLLKQQQEKERREARKAARRRAKKAAARKAAREAREAEEARAAERQRIVDYALQFVGNPYVYGGTSLTNGADCSGFVQSVFGDFGYSLPRVASSQAYAGTAKPLDQIEAGDLVFYAYGGSISHVALYIGNGQIVHASNAATGIKISNYDYQTPYMAAAYLA